MIEISPEAIRRIQSSVPLIRDPLLQKTVLRAIDGIVSGSGLNVLDYDDYASLDFATGENTDVPAVRFALLITILLCDRGVTNADFVCLSIERLMGASVGSIRDSTFEF
jgi:hypothetical protein